MNKENWLYIGLLVALTIGLLIGYQISSIRYSKEIKGLEEGFDIACEGLNAVNDAMRPISYLTGINPSNLNCPEVIQTWKIKYR